MECSPPSTTGIAPRFTIIRIASRAIRWLAPNWPSESGTSPQSTILTGRTRDPRRNRNVCGTTGRSGETARGPSVARSCTWPIGGVCTTIARAGRLAYIDGRHVLRKRPLALHRTVPAGRREVRVGIVDGPQLDRVGQLEGIEPRSPGPGLDCHLSWPAPRVLAHARQGSGLGPLAESSASPDSRARPRARGGRARGPPRPDAVRATPPLPCASRLPSSP